MEDKKKPPFISVIISTFNVPGRSRRFFFLPKALP